MKLRLMPDYDCHPLWETLPDGVRNVAPEELSLSPGLRQELRAWAARYDATLNRDDPSASGFKSAEDERDFEETGVRLWERLRQEMGARAEVSYFSQLEHRELT
ncbi:MAG TPA: hypothetical protein VFA20_34580 [Myxococcaceae bacterium]|nr:hypothetical protein [Myxococcaceae bacterium]